MSGFVTAWVAISVAGAGIAVSSSQASKPAKSIKNAANDAQKANDKAIAEAKLAQDTAGSQAQAQIDARRKRMSSNQTIYTSPLGIQDQAAIAKKTLLGS